MRSPGTSLLAYNIFIIRRLNIVNYEDPTEEENLSMILQRRNNGIKVLGIGAMGFLFSGLIDSFGIALIFWLVCVVGLFKVISVAYSPCPYCKKQFFWTWYWSNPLTSKCMHCGRALQKS